VKMREVLQGSICAGTSVRFTVCPLTDAETGEHEGMKGSNVRCVLFSAFSSAFIACRCTGEGLTRI
jgi:hypothetical protein